MEETNSKGAEARHLAERLKERCVEKKLPYAAFYFTFLGEHFAAQAARAREEQLASLSPFVYAMQ